LGVLIYRTARDNHGCERMRAPRGIYRARTVVAADEAVAVLLPQLTVNVLLRLLESDVHEPVEHDEDAYEEAKER
jgi:hypothetical protein